MAAVPDYKRLRLNHPNAVWREWRKSVAGESGSTPKLTPLEQLKEENARLRREVERGGDLFAPTDTAKDIAAVIRAKVTASKAKAIAVELQRLARD